MAAHRTIRIEPSPRIAVDVEGQGPLLVFLHGIGGNRGNWRDQLPVFAGDFTAAAWDARGYGGSDDYDGPLDFADFSGDLLRLLDHFKAERAHLCGLSMGGRIAMDFHDRHPERVASLTLSDTQPGLAQMPEEKRREFIRLRQEPLRAGKTPADIAPGVARSLVSPHAVPGAFERLVDSMAALRAPSYLKTIEGSFLYARAPDLESIRVPTHIVVGDDDGLTPPELARAMARRIAGARLTVIPEAGHLANLEQPRRFNAAVLGFLREQL
ncbi:MAG TPA: alpha/beta fold hydrolase [Stellaceae bacterium]|nr:alpha/beta fold hydrolase [Stellaceae bacterium]